jgi:predicted site-specific integrase-resolvase
MAGDVILCRNRFDSAMLYQQWSDATDHSMIEATDRSKMNVGIYARVSTDKQDTGNQIEQLREFADRQGWTIAVE